MYNEFYAELIGYPAYGVPVVDGVFVLLALSWLIFFLSKLIFKEFFNNKLWKAAFIIMVTAPTMIEVYLGSIYALIADPLINYFEPETMSPDTIFSFHFVFFPLLTVFTFAYMIEFIVRLVRQRRMIGNKEE